MKDKEDYCAKAFESVLDEVGHFGYFQKRLFLLSSCLQIVAVPVFLYLSVLSELPTTYSHVCEDNNITSGNAGICINVTTRGPIHNLPEWMYNNSTKDNLDIVFYVQSFGLCLGCILGGLAADLLGRKHILFVSFASMMASHCLLAACSDVTSFCTARLATSIFAGSFIVPSTVLYIEYTGRNWRDVCVCACLWWLGMVMIAVHVMITHNWLYLALSTGLIGLPFSGMFFIFPESFRWFCCRQKFHEAESVLNEMISCNTYKKPDVTSVCDDISSSVINAMRVRTYTYLDIFKCRKRILSTCVLCFTSFASCAVYRCLMEKVWNLTDHLYIDIVLRYVVDLPIIFTALIISKCIGRRWCIFLYAMSSGFALICVLVLSVVNELLTDEDILTGISLFGKLGVATTIVFFFLVAIETYPTTIRCMGTALVITSDICGLVFGRYLFALLDQSYHFTSLYIGYGTVMFIIGFTALLLPETYNQPLPDIVHSRHRIIASQTTTRIAHGWRKLRKDF